MATPPGKLRNRPLWGRSPKKWASQSDCTNTKESKGGKRRAQRKGRGTGPRGRTKRKGPKGAVRNSTRKEA